MFVTARFVARRYRTCGPCLTEGEVPGPCQCTDEEWEAEATAEVAEPVNEDAPRIEIVSVRDADSGRAWSDAEKRRLDERGMRFAAEEALWFAYDAACEEAKKAELEREAHAVADLLETHVRLATQSGTSPERIRKFLKDVKTAVLTGRVAA